MLFRDARSHREKSIYAVLRISLAVCILSGASSCTAFPAQEVLSELAIDDGTPLSSLLRGPEQKILLVLTPDDCFTCINHIFVWLDWSRENPENLVVAFTREPNETETRRFISLRIRDYVVLDEHPDLPYLPVPSEYLIQNDTVRYWERIERGVVGSTLVDHVVQEKTSRLPSQKPVPLIPPQ